MLLRAICLCFHLVELCKNSFNRISADPSTSGKHLSTILSLRHPRTGNISHPTRLNFLQLLSIWIQLIFSCYWLRVLAKMFAFVLFFVSLFLCLFFKIGSMLLCTFSTLRLWMILCNQETKCATSMLMEFFKSFIGLSNLMDPGSLGIMFVKVKIDSLLILQLGASIQLPKIMNEKDSVSFCCMPITEIKLLPFLAILLAIVGVPSIHLYENTLPRILIIFCIFAPFQMAACILLPLLILFSFSCQSLRKLEWRFVFSVAVSCQLEQISYDILILISNASTLIFQPLYMKSNPYLKRSIIFY